MIRQFEVMGSQQVNHHLLCSICNEVFYNPIRATCGHTFCGICLVRWIQQKKSCPICRHQLERNYQFDKDIIANKIVGDIQIKCLRCQQWNGTIALFKQHKLKQCKFVQTNDEVPQNVIEIFDDQVDISYSYIIAKSPILVQIYELDDQLNQDLQLQEAGQNYMQNDQSHNPIIINDQSNHIVIDTQDDLQLEESNQQSSQIIVSPNYQQYIDLDKSDKEDLLDIQEAQYKYDRSINNNPQVTQSQQLLNNSELEISELPLRILNNKDIKELKSTRKFRLNILQKTLGIAEPLIDSMNDEIFQEFIDHMNKEMKNKLNTIFNTLIL